MRTLCVGAGKEPLLDKAICYLLERVEPLRQLPTRILVSLKLSSLPPSMKGGAGRGGGRYAREA